MYLKKITRFATVFSWSYFILQFSLALLFLFFFTYPEFIVFLKVNKIWDSRTHAIFKCLRISIFYKRTIIRERSHLKKLNNSRIFLFCIQNLVCFSYVNAQTKLYKCSLCALFRENHSKEKNHLLCKIEFPS